MENAENAAKPVHLKGNECIDYLKKYLNLRNSTWCSEARSTVRCQGRFEFSGFSRFQLSGF